MIVYRITHKKFADELTASGIINRWNLAAQFVIYTAGSIALACLENLVYTSGGTLGISLYSCMEIFVPDNASITIVSLKELPVNYNGEELNTVTQEIGNKWYTQNKDLILKVPSAIIPSESNFIINTRHNDFKNVKINRSEPFFFDKRFINPGH